MRMKAGLAMAPLMILALHASIAASAAEPSQNKTSQNKTARTQASSEERRVKAVFDLFDENHDGFISMAEYKNNQMLVFYLWDRNKDLVLTQNETPFPPDVFARVAGADGKIDSVEFLNLVDDAFRQADANHDGKLDRQEFEFLRQHIRQ